MDRDGLTNLLALAERHIVEGEAVIERQRALIELMLANGLDTVQARELLEQFRESHSVYQAHRDRFDRLLHALSQEKQDPAQFE